MFKDLTFIDNDLNKNGFLGIVIYNKDPLYSGRCKIRVFGIMDSITDDFIPWSTPINSNIFSGDGSGSLSVPKIGSFVRVIFNNGNIYSPEYVSVQNIDKSLIDKIKDDYEGTHVLIYDSQEDINIIYQRGSGLTIFHKESYINIGQDSMITIQHANQDSVIQLEGKKINVMAKNEIHIGASGLVDVTADEVKIQGNISTKIGDGDYVPACLSDAVWTAIKSLAQSVDEKLPSTPGVNLSVVETLASRGVSNNVLIGK